MAATDPAQLLIWGQKCGPLLWTTAVFTEFTGCEVTNYRVVPVLCQNSFTLSKNCKEGMKCSIQKHIITKTKHIFGADWMLYTLYFAFLAVCWKQHEEPFNCLNSPNLVILRLALRQCLSACLSFHVLICEMLHWSLSLFPPCAIPTFFRISVDVHVSIITKFYTTLSFSLRLMTLNIIWQFQQLKKVSWGSGIGPFLYYF